MNRTITYISNVRMPTEKAHGVQIAKMCESFSLSGADIELVVPRRNNVIHEDAFSFYGLKNHFKITYVFSLDVMDKFWGLGYWIQLSTFTLSIIFKYLFSSRKKKFIYTREFMIAVLMRWMGFEVVYEAHRILLKKRTFFFLLKPIKKIVTNSKGVADEFRQHGFKEVLPLPNGIDLDEFRVSESKDILRKELALPADKKIALYSGYLYKWKGVDTIVSAAEVLSQEDIFFVIIGGSFEDIKAYREKVSERKLSNIVFLGNQDRRKVPLYLKSADVLLLPNSAISEESVKYTSPIKLFEYMASGVPVVSSDMPSLREILNEGNSVLVKPDDAHALLDGISKIVHDTQFADTLSRKAYSDVSDLTWKKRAERILSFI